MSKFYFNLHRYTFLLFVLLFAFSVSGQNLPRPQIKNNKTSEYNCSRSIELKQLMNEYNGEGALPTEPSANFLLNKKKANRAEDCATNWASLTGTALVDALKSTTEYEPCLRDVFAYSNVYTNANVIAVCDAITSGASSYDGTFDTGMYGLWVYVHAAGFHDFFEDAFTISDAAWAKVREACDAFSTNTHLYDLNEEAFSVLDEYLVVLDNDDIRNTDAAITVVKRVMSDFAEDKVWLPFKSNSEKMISYTTMVNRIFFLMFRGMQPVDPDFEQALLDDADFTALVAKIATDEDIMSNEYTSFIAENSVLELSRMMDSKVADQVGSYLADIVKNSERLSVDWMRGMEALNKNGDCEKYDLCEDMDALSAELKGKKRTKHLYSK